MSPDLTANGVGGTIASNRINISNLAKQDEIIKKTNSNKHTKNSLTKDFGYHNKEENGLIMNSLNKAYNSNIGA